MSHKITMSLAIAAALSSALATAVSTAARPAPKRMLRSVAGGSERLRCRCRHHLRRDLQGRLSGQPCVWQSFPNSSNEFPYQRVGGDLQGAFSRENV